MSDKVNVGIIGCGWIGDLKHIPNYAKNPRANLVAICDIDPARLEFIKTRHGLQAVKTYTDYRELLANPEIDMVVVSTPNGSHSEIAVAALEARKHVLCEKPMAVTAEDCRKMLDAARKADRKLTVGYQWRYRPECLYIKDLCDSGFLGDIYFAKAHALRRRGVPVWGTYFNLESNGGGVLQDGAPHALDMTLWAMNNYEPASVTANVYRKMYDQPEGNPWGSWDPNKFEVEDAGFALITMKNGATIFLEAAWIINVAEGNDMKTTLCGTKAGVDMFDEGGVRVNLIQNGNMALLKPDVKPGWNPMAPTLSPPELEAKHWLDSLLLGTEVFVKPEQALVVTQIIEAVYQSGRTGKTVLL